MIIVEANEGFDDMGWYPQRTHFDITLILIFEIGFHWYNGTSNFKFRKLLIKEVTCIMISISCPAVFIMAEQIKHLHVTYNDIHHLIGQNTHKIAKEFNPDLLIAIGLFCSPVVI